MSFTLIKGTFHVLGYSPDGDSIRFKAKDASLWKKLSGPAVELNARGMHSYASRPSTPWKRTTRASASQSGPAVPPLATFSPTWELMRSSGMRRIALWSRPRTVRLGSSWPQHREQPPPGSLRLRW